MKAKSYSDQTGNSAQQILPLLYNADPNLLTLISSEPTPDPIPCGTWRPDEGKRSMSSLTYNTFFIGPTYREGEIGLS